MENKNDTFVRYFIGAIIIIVLTFIALRKPHNLTPPPIYNGCNEDSLRSEINNLQAELDLQSDGFDKKEERYENILFEYEYGLSRLKETHPDAYREFHRIIAYKEKYSHETERENKKRLKSLDKF